MIWAGSCCAATDHRVTIMMGAFCFSEGYVQLVKPGGSGCNQSVSASGIGIVIKEVIKQLLRLSVV